MNSTDASNASAYRSFLAARVRACSHASLATEYAFEQALAAQMALNAAHWSHKCASTH